MAAVEMYAPTTNNLVSSTNENHHYDNVDVSSNPSTHRGHAPNRHHITSSTTNNENAGALSNSTSKARSRRVVFYKNGDKYFPGKVVTVTPSKHYSFRELMSDLNRSVDLPYGVRRVYSPASGREIYDIEELVDGSSYVAASFEPFRPAKYGENVRTWNTIANRQDMSVPALSNTATPSHQLPPLHHASYQNNHMTHDPNFSRQYNTPGYYLSKGYLRNLPILTNATNQVNSGFTITSRRQYQQLPSLANASTSQTQPINQKSHGAGGAAAGTEHLNKPRLITIVRATERPRKKITILLNRKAMHNYEQFVSDISLSFGLPHWKNDKIRKLYTLRGRKVQGISDFFREDDVFIGVSGKEPLKASLLLDLLKEVNAEDDQTAHAMLKEWEASRSKSRARKSNHNTQSHGVLNKLASNNLVNSSTNKIDGGQMPAANHQQPNNQPTEDLSKSVELDERYKKKKKKKVVVNSTSNIIEGDIMLEMEAQRQRERLKLMEAERRKKELQSMQQNKENNAGGTKVKRVNIVSPNSESNEVASNGESSKRAKRKPKLKRLDESDNNTNQPITPIEMALVDNHDKQPPQPQPAANTRSTPVPKTRVTPTKQHDEKHHNHQEKRDEPEVKHVEHQIQKEEEKKHDEKKVDDHANHKKVNDTPRSNNSYVSNKMKRQISSVSKVTDKYDIGKTLGDGNFAVVKYAKQRGTEQEYAIKIIDKSKMKGKEYMLENEIFIMKSCRHPNIVNLHEEFETKDEIYLITDLIKGGDLFDAISQSVKFNEKDSACMVQDVCEALLYLHAKNIVHRDLKPENLLFMRKKDDRISIKLADFGLAMVVKEPIFTVCGTPTYVAPEILSEIGYGLEVDMWACGIITYILLCGFPPFRSIDRNQDELFQNIQSGVFEYLMPYWEGISESSKDLINHLLVVDAKKRWKAEDVLCHQWIITQGNSKPLPANFDDFKKEHTQKLKDKCKKYAAEPFAVM